MIPLLLLVSGVHCLGVSEAIQNLLSAGLNALFLMFDSMQLASAICPSAGPKHILVISGVPTLRVRAGRVSIWRSFPRSRTLGSSVTLTSTDLNVRESFTRIVYRAAGRCVGADKACERQSSLATTRISLQINFPTGRLVTREERKQDACFLSVGRR